MSKNFAKNQRWLIVSALLFALVFGAIGTVHAAEFPKGSTIPAGETIDDDVFISGENVVIDGNVNGMLFASGSKVVLNGYVAGDVLLIGETVTVSETAVIDGNLFIAGADLSVNGQVAGSVFGGSSAMELGANALVGRNMYYGGFSISTTDGSRISKDLFAAGYQGMFNGSIDRDLGFAGAAVEINNIIGRNATLDVGRVEESRDANSAMFFNPYISKYVDRMIDPGIRVSDKAKINGKLTYTSSVNYTGKLEAVTSGAVIYQTPVPYEDSKAKDEFSGNVKEFSKRSIPGVIFGSMALGVVRDFIKLFVIGALGLWIFAKPFKRLTDAANAEPLKAIGWGFVLVAIGFMAMFILPIVFILTGILVGFLSLGSLIYFWFGIAGTTFVLSFMLFCFAVFTLSKIIAAFLFGKWILQGLFKQQSEKPWLNLLLGVFLYVLIHAIPVAGFLAGLTATLFGAGAFWLAFIQKRTA